MGSAGLTASEYVSFWYFNLKTSVTPSGVTAVAVNDSSVPGWEFAARTGTNTDTDTSEKDATFKADGDGYFDLRFGFATSAGTGRFGADETAVFRLTGVGLSAEAFKAVSVFGSTGKNGFYSAAHIQSIGANGADSGWIAGSPGPGGSSVPLPGVAVAGAVLMSGAALRRRRVVA